MEELLTQIIRMLLGKKSLHSEIEQLKNSGSVFFEDYWTRSGVNDVGVIVSPIYNMQFHDYFCNDGTRKILRTFNIVHWDLDDIEAKRFYDFKYGDKHLQIEFFLR